MRPRTFLLLFIASVGCILLGFSWINKYTNSIVNITGHILIIIPIIIILIHSYRKLKFLSEYYVPDELPFFVLRTDITLAIKDSLGELATYQKRQKCKILKNGITGFRMSNLRADGSIDRFRVGKSGDDLSKPIPIVRLDDKTYEVIVEFDRPYHTGELVERIIEFDFIDSFKGKKEYFKIDFVHPVQIHDTKIIWPVDYNITKIYVEEKFPLEEKLKKTVTWLTIQSENNTKFIKHKFLKPKVGTKAAFFWERDI